MCFLQSETGVYKYSMRNTSYKDTALYSVLYLSEFWTQHYISYKIIILTVCQQSSFNCIPANTFGGCITVFMAAAGPSCALITGLKDVTGPDGGSTSGRAPIV